MQTMTLHANAVAAVIYGLGYRPANYGALLGLDAQGCSTGVGGTDLSILSRHPDAVAAKVLPPFVEHGVVEVVLVVFSEDLDRAALVARVEAACHAQALNLRCAVGVTSGGYGDLRDPSELRPLAEIEYSPVAATQVATGHVLAESRAALLPAPATNGQGEARAAALRWASEGHDADVAVMMWTRFLDGGTVTPAAAGALAASLEDQTLTDAVFVALLPDGAQRMARMVAGDAETRSEISRQAIRDALHPSSSAHPSTEADNLLAALTQVLAYMPASVPAWTLWAWCQWWMFGTPAADTALREALRLNPNYKAASLLRQIIDAGIVPGYTKNK